jgi:hypothetical protein
MVVRSFALVDNVISVALLSGHSQPVFQELSHETKGQLSPQWSLSGAIPDT